MCGIFGLVNYNDGAEKYRRQIESATDLMSHRGPDGRGVWICESVAFGHRRLAIIDLTGSPQPMLSIDGRYALTYNGELYNFKELRNELILDGIKFTTTGDTEVVLKALIHWGVDALVKFNGMFSFGFWDRKLEQLTIARDRLGVKPMFFANKNQQFAFASEYPPLLSLDWISHTPDPVGITAYLSHFQTTFDGKTIYRDISTLDGGEFAIYDRSGFRKQKYWNLPVMSTESKRSQWSESRIPEAAIEVSRLMGAAVKSHSIADVDVGVFLSGGIDSAIITSLMCEQSTERVKAYSIGFAESGFNEFEFSSGITENLGLRHSVQTFNDDDYFPLMKELIRHKGAPLSTPNEIPIYSLAKTAAKELKVVLTGEGSDELFGGYTGIFCSPEDLANAERLRRHPEDLSPDERNQIRLTLRQIYGKSGFKGELDHWTSIYAWLSRRDLAQILGGDIDLNNALAEIDHCWQSKFDDLEGLSTSDRYLYLFETEHLRGLLTRLDSCTMAGSLEGRVPFTDNNLVEFVWRLPFEYKLNWNRSASTIAPASFATRDATVVGKHILKEAFKGRIDDTISGRRKKAFPVPLEIWLNGAGRDKILETFQQSGRVSGGILSGKVADWTINTLATGNSAMKVWMVWNLARWLEGN